MPKPNAFADLRDLLNPPGSTVVKRAMAAARPQFQPRQSRSDRLNMRLFPADKKSIEETAAALGMSPGDYLIALHRAALKKIEIPKS